jgi:CBS domain containing-hemolysin-like protein
MGDSHPSSAATPGGNGHGGGNGTGPERGLFWRLQGLLRRREAESVRDRVEELIEGTGGEDTKRGGASDEEIGPHERVLLRNVLRLRGKTAYDVMVPRADILAMPENLTLEQAIRLIQRDGHSRYPVYREQLDDIVGMVHIKDVFAAVGRGEQPANGGGAEPFSLKAILRKPLFVVPSVPVLDLLLQMRQARIHMALVVDEYGGIDGLVTIEDLVETIVGDISDEHDEPGPPQIAERPDGTLELDARTPVEVFEAKLGPVLTNEERAADIDTVGGLVFTLAGRVPAKGELVSHPSGLEFRVLDSDPRRIRRLRVRRPGVGPAATASAAAAPPTTASRDLTNEPRAAAE